MLTVIVALTVFSILIIIHEAGHLIAAKKAGITVEVFSLGMGKKLFSKEVGGTDYRVSLIPFGGYIKMAGDDPNEATGKDDEFNSKPVGHRFWVIAAGVITNYVFAFVLFSIIFMIGVPTLSNKVGQIIPDYPAAESGIKVGDRILSINAREVEYWDDIVKAIKEESTKAETLDVEILRGEKRIPFHITPHISTVTNVFGQTISRPIIGVAPQSEVLAVSYDPFRAVFHGGKRLFMLTRMTYKGIWLLITGGMPVKSSVSGPIGIANLMGQAARLGFVPLLIITAHVSMALAIFNALPFPVLDGGHILFLALEKIRGKPLSTKVQEIITQVSIVLIIAFALFVSWQDIVKLVPWGK